MKTSKFLGISLEVYFILVIFALIIPVIGFVALPLLLASGGLALALYVVNRLLHHQNTLNENEDRTPSESAKKSNSTNGTLTNGSLGSKPEEAFIPGLRSTPHRSNSRSANRENKRFLNSQK